MTYFIASSSSLSDRHAVRRTENREIDRSTREIRPTAREALSVDGSGLKETQSEDGRQRGPPLHALPVNVDTGRQLGRGSSEPLLRSDLEVAAMFAVAVAKRVFRGGTD